MSLDHPRHDVRVSAPRTPAEHPETRYAPVGSLRLAYEEFGDHTAEPMLMIMGLGTQMIAWPDALCSELAGRGYRVIRFDNRDVGLSTHLDHLPAPTVRQALASRDAAPYTVADMADDAAGLLEALGLTAAHVVGASLGGFIAQTLALRHPERVRSLALFMTSTGSRLVGRAKPRIVVRAARRRAATTREAAVESVVETFLAIGSSGYTRDLEALRDIATRAYERGHDPRGYQRQLAAALRQPNRTRDLARLRVPTVVLHGLADPLVGPSGGRALARAIPGATFVGYPGMGHDLPRDLWPDFADRIDANAHRATPETAGRSHEPSEGGPRPVADAPPG